MVTLTTIDMMISHLSLRCLVLFAFFEILISHHQVIIVTCSSHLLLLVNHLSLFISHDMPLRYLCEAIVVYNPCSTISLICASAVFEFIAMATFVWGQLQGT